MTGRLVLPTALVALALVAGAESGAGTATGLHGLVTRSPARPVCIEGTPCGKPAAGVVLVFRRSGVTVARTRTTASGAYRVVLRRGTYAVSVSSGRAGTLLSPRRVRVIAGRMTRVDFELDTGLQ